jgi:hypothetical protein
MDSQKISFNISEQKTEGSLDYIKQKLLAISNHKIKCETKTYSDCYYGLIKKYEYYLHQNEPNISYSVNILNMRDNFDNIVDKSIILNKKMNTLRNMIILTTFCYTYRECCELLFIVKCINYTIIQYLNCFEYWLNFRLYLSGTKYICKSSDIKNNNEILGQLKLEFNNCMNNNVNHPNGSTLLNILNGF